MNMVDVYRSAIIAGTKVFEVMAYNPVIHDEMKLGKMYMWGHKDGGWLVARLEHKSIPMLLADVFANYYFKGLISSATSVEEAQASYTDLYKKKEKKAFAFHCLRFDTARVPRRPGRSHPIAMPEVSCFQNSCGRLAGGRPCL
jgi:hypothetical protein